MAAASLGKRLSAELHRGGKKTVALGLLLLAGSLFWIPLAWKAVFPSEDQPKSGSVAAKQPQKSTAAPTNKNADATASNEPTPGEAIDWRKFRRQLDNMPVIKPEPWNELLRDPFSQDWITAASEQQSTGPTGGPSSIESLVLSATRVGAEGRTAVINGKLYHEGDALNLVGSKASCIVKVIRPGEVVLELDGKQVAVGIKRLRSRIHTTKDETAQGDQPGKEAEL